jgi:hypothetical protein
MRRAVLFALLLTGALTAPASAAVTITSSPTPEGDAIEVTVENTDLLAATVSTSSGTATEDTDFDATSHTAPSGTSTFDIPTTEDSAPELDETIALTATRLGSTVATATATITDDDPPALALFDNSASEASNGVSVAVSRSPISRPTTVGWSVSGGGTATAADLGATSGTITIPAGAAFGVITIPVVDDSADEPDETVGITIAAAGTTITRAAGTATITNDDVRTLTVNDARVTESDEDAGTTARVLVSLDGPTFRTVTAQFATVPVTARTPADFTTRTGTVTFTPGQTQAFIDVPVRSDEALERSETFAVLVGRQAGANLGRGAAVVTIADDDTAQGDEEPPDMRVTKPRRSGRSLAVKVTCPRGERRCRGRVTFFTRADRRSRVRSLRRERRLGRKSFSLAGGRSKTVKLTVPRRTASAARRAGRLRVRAFVVTTDANDNTDTTTASTTLRFRR